MYTYLHLFASEPGRVFPTSVLRTVLRLVEARTILSMSLYDAPLRWKSESTSFAEFGELPVDRCLLEIEENKPVVAVLDALFTDWSYRLGRRIDSLPLAETAGTSTSSIFVIFGPSTVPGDGEAEIPTTCQVVLSGDGVPPEPNAYASIVSGYPEIRSLLADLAIATDCKWAVTWSVA
jgi:hypothetical protein